MLKVSVIVPVYNTEKYLEKCLDALVHQTLDDIEIVIVNDGSTDTSVKIIERFKRDYPEKIKFISKENGGQATARNVGIKAASGKYIGFADSDDCVDRSMFEKMYELAEKKSCDMVECNFHFVQETKNGLHELKARGNVRNYKNRKDMFIDPQVSPWNKLYRRDVLLESGILFPEGLIYEDTAFYIKTISFIERSAYLDEKLVYYYLRGNSTMNANKSRKVADIFSVLQDILDFYNNKGLFQQYYDELEYFYVKILLCSSLSRIGRVRDKKLKNAMLDETFALIQEKFPQYKSNKYFSGRIGKYIRTVNRSNSGLISTVLGKIMKG